MGIQSGARFPARCADAVSATQYGHFRMGTSPRRYTEIGLLHLAPLHQGIERGVYAEGVDVQATGQQGSWSGA
jgi:hypothetical protein